MPSSAVATAPNKIDWSTYSTRSVLDDGTTPEAYDTTIPEGGAIGAEDFQQPDRWQAGGWRLTAGETGERTSLEMYGHLGRIAIGLMNFANVRLPDEEYRFRTGLYHDEDAYAMFVVDTSRNENYHAVVESPDDGRVVDRDLGLAVGEQRSWESLALHSGQVYPEDGDPIERQTWFVHGTDTGQSNAATKDAFERPVRARVDIAAPEGSNAQPSVDLLSFQAGGFTGH
jgi:hypothetical protein